MADEKTDTAAAPAVVDTAEVVSATPEVAKEVEIVPPVTDEVAPAVEDVEEASAETASAEAVPEATPEPILFDAETDDIPVTVEKAQKVLDQYELPADVQSAFEALRAKANATPAAELAIYGDTEAVKASLERNDLLYSVTETPTGEFRPNTDKFVAELSSEAPEKVDWLFFDIANTPSHRYPKISRFEEAMVDYFGTVGEPVNDVISRAQQVKDFMAQGLPQGDMPSFVPVHLRQAFFSLQPASRADLEALESSNEYGELLYTDADRARKVDELTRIQRGLDADRMDLQRHQQDLQIQREAFNATVVETQDTVFSGVRDAFVASMIDEVKFSDNAKVQALLCHQQVTTLQQAFLPDADGEFARKALAEAGIKFDLPKARAIIRDIEKASVELTLIRTQVDEHGNQQNTVELNKAAKRLEEATRKFQDFGSDIIRQEKQIASVGAQESVDKAVEKRKLELKTRPSLKAATQGAKQSKTVGDKPPANITPFTPAWDEWYADRAMADAAKRGNR